MPGRTTDGPQPLTMSEAIDMLRDLYEMERSYNSHRENLVNRANNPRYSSPQWDRISESLDGVLAETQSSIEQILEAIQRYPPNHDRHFRQLREFNTTTKYEESVFIMTKFPEGKKKKKAQQLHRIISTVEDALGEIGLMARMATGAKYHDWLWDEVEIHLLGCFAGVAIVEDNYRSELNPNVAMEWGWMRALGKRVLFLVEQTFSHGRADWGGLRSWQFNWEKPEPGIRRAIKEFFSD